jgi:methylated-DNA-[protein]-cysteine S-methyltransferase
MDASPNQKTAYCQTPVGVTRIIAEDGYITSVSVRDEEIEVQPTDDPLINMAIQQLDEYFAGKRRLFDFPMRQKGSDFELLVWDELSKIDYAKTISYSQQSKLMNTPLAIRAIAAANGRNDLWLVVPCHRVIGADGSLTGYASGIWRKQWLLEHEARVAGVGQTKLFL